VAGYGEFFDKLVSESSLACLPGPERTWIKRLGSDSLFLSASIRNYSDVFWENFYGQWLTQH